MKTTQKLKFHSRVFVSSTLCIARKLRLAMLVMVPEGFVLISIFSTTIGHFAFFSFDSRFGDHVKTGFSDFLDPLAFTSRFLLALILVLNLFFVW